MSEHETPRGWKPKVIQQLRGYWLIVAYLTLVFAAFTQYRRLVLAIHGIEYGNYLIGLVKAIVLGKVLMLGDALRLARGMDRRPLIYPTLYKTVVFTLFLLGFTVLEDGIRGLWKGDGFIGGIRELFSTGLHELVGSLLVMFVSLIPFFAFRELSRLLGPGELAGVFFSASRLEKWHAGAAERGG